MDCQQKNQACHGNQATQIQNLETSLCNDSDSLHGRRSAHYKPNIWNYDFLQSLNCGRNDKEETMKRFAMLMKDVKAAFDRANDMKTKLELVDSIRKLGLSDLFAKEIKEAVENTCSVDKGYSLVEDQGLYTAALHFRLARDVSHPGLQDNIMTFMEMAEWIKIGDMLGGNTKIMDTGTTVELLEALHLALKAENVSDKVKDFATETLMRELLNSDFNSDGDEKEENRLIMRKEKHCLEMPMCRRVRWLDVKWQIESYGGSEGANQDLLKLAKINFNELQATHQRDLREVSRWWVDLGLMGQVEFTRDRLVESFLCALGLAHEPRFSRMRKSLTKVIILVLVIDDVYDLFGSIKELECFTRGVTSWDPAIIGHLPECMKVCFRALYDVTHDIARDIGGEMHWNCVLPHLKKAWADFCNALFVESKWDSAGHVPSLDEYLDNAWVSSSGPLILSHAYFFVVDVDLGIVPDVLRMHEDLIYNSSMIIRLCNDLATSKVERDRGDAPSSVVCHMLEANVSEDLARKHIQGLIDKSWKNIHELCIVANDWSSKSSRSFVDVTVNAARVAHTLYQYGDGFGNQALDIRAQILSTIIEPFTIELDGVEILSDNNNN